MSQSYISICNVCHTRVQTKSDQRNNKNFICSKECNRLLHINKEKNVLDKMISKISSHNIPIQTNCIKCNVSYKESQKKNSKK